MLYTAQETRDKLLGKELDQVTKELEIVEQAIGEAVAVSKTYCLIKFHIAPGTVSKLQELGYNVSLNSSNRCTYVSWLS